LSQSLELIAPAAEYIVMFKKGTAPSVIDKQIEEVQQNGGKITQRYDSILLVRSTIASGRARSDLT
jgi:hypothetical protein